MVTARAVYGVEDRLRCAVHLGLVRALPLFYLSPCPVADEVARIVACGPLNLADAGERSAHVMDVRRLLAFAEDCAAWDGLRADYLHSRVAELAVTLASDIDDVERAWDHSADRMLEIWGNADMFVHEGWAWRELPFRTIRPPLAEIEQEWQQRDVAMLVEAEDVPAALAERLAVLRQPSRWARRQEIATAVRGLAPW
ncbi:hypothetical protein [Actinoplanes rectilineatus]|uniref:hypothetical protein n=1 Tax=Actinoplanes rectilineatus TaxID=113571 RepID=UPI0005F27CFC|nr:hypothetical protein [Actinoplanes rectilineatus]